ncbi:MAG: hypothetical protein ACOZE5_17170 [Verrucomicrobiota bacterium]
MPSTANFPVFLVADELTISEVQAFTERIARCLAQHGELEGKDFFALSAEDAADWHPFHPRPPASAPSPEVPMRLVVLGITPWSRDRLFALGERLCRRHSGRDPRTRPSPFESGPGCLRRSFADMERMGIGVQRGLVRDAANERTTAMFLMARTEPAINDVMQSLGVESWKPSLLLGWAGHNEGQPMPLHRLDPEVSQAGFLAEAARLSRLAYEANNQPPLNVQAFSLGFDHQDNGDDPAKLIIACKDGALGSFVQQAARKAGAPDDMDGVGRFRPPTNRGQAGFLSEMFGAMESAGLPAISILFAADEGPVDGNFGRQGLFVLARTPAAVRSVKHTLGISGWRRAGG